MIMIVKTPVVERSGNCQARLDACICMYAYMYVCASRGKGARQERCKVCRDLRAGHGTHSRQDVYVLHVQSTLYSPAYTTCIHT